jgi:hypothetical protein
MKLFILVLLLTSSTLCFGIRSGSQSSDDTKKLAGINQLLELFKVDEWISFVKLVKNDEVIPAYYTYEEPSKIERAHLINYDLKGYSKGIVNQFKKHLTNKEILASIKLFKRPFLVKTLKKLEKISFDYTQIQNESDGNTLTRSRSNYIESIYNLTSMQVIVDYEFNKYQLLVEQMSKKNEVLSNSKIKSTSVRSLIELDPKRFKSLVIVSINNELSNYKDVELADFIRILKLNKEALKSIQVYRTFNYLYSQKFI